MCSAPYPHPSEHSQFLPCDHSHPLFHEIFPLGRGASIWECWNQEGLGLGSAGVRRCWDQEGLESRGAGLRRGWDQDLSLPTSKEKPCFLPGKVPPPGQGCWCCCRGWEPWLLSQCLSSSPDLPQVLQSLPLRAAV